MADSYTQCQWVNKINELLKENERFDWVYVGFNGYKRSREIHLRLLKSLVCYTSEWSDEEKYKHLGSDHALTAWKLEAQLKHFVDLPSLAHFGRSPLPSHEFQEEVAAIYGKLIVQSHPLVIAFSEFVASAQAILPLCHDVLELKRNHAVRACKLASFRDLIRRCLADAGAALVLSLVRAGCENQTTDRLQSSAHEPQDVQIYGLVLGGYREIITAAAAAAVAAENPFVHHDFMAVFQSVGDIMGDILDYPLMDLVVKQEEEQVEDWLKLAFVPVVREAGSCLSSSVPNVLLHNLKLIKAEMFALELHNHKSRLCGVSGDDDLLVSTLREAFAFLSKFFKMREPEEHMVGDSGKLAFSLIQASLTKAAARSLCDSHQAQRFTEDMIFRSSLVVLKLFKAEAMSLVLIDNDATLKFLAGYRLENLQRSLIFLGALLSDPPNHDYVEDGLNVSTFIEALVTQTTAFICSLGGNKMEKDQSAVAMNMNINVLTSHLSKKIELNSIEMKAAYWRAGLGRRLSSNFPKKDGDSFVDFLLAEIRKLLINKPDVISFMKDQVEVLLEELEYLRSFLKDVKQKNNEDEERVVCLIYEAEYIIDLFVVGDVPVWYHQMVLFNAIAETKLTKGHILGHYHKEETTICDVQPILKRVALEDSNLGTDEVIVGFDNHAKIIMDQLTTGPRSRQIVSIVGMPGLGKTTLAKKIYNHLSIQHHFMVRAWCCVSQVYQKRELLLDILDDFVQLTDDEIQRMDDERLAKTLYQNLKGKRYLVVIDDIWSGEPWSELQRSLPDDGKGSRILFTSRVHNVALQREPYALTLLCYGESWDLLQEKLFHGGSCPKHLLQVGMLIAKNCKGLPLAIVVISGLLKKIEKTKDRWEEIAEDLRSRIVAVRESRFMSILEFSYNHLPSHLKPCFLYLGIFLEGKEVPVQKLKELWIAEGFIPEMAGRSLEGTADDYLLGLTSRSLVMEGKRRSRGGTKTCHMHDLVRDLCLKKAKEENFMQLITAKDTDNSAPRASMFYRLCVHSTKDHFMRLISTKDAGNSGPFIHSLLFFPTGDSDNWRSYDVSCICQNFKSLRVLYLEYVNVEEPFFSGIELMLCLKYLAVRGNINSIPPSIAALWNLETLIVLGRRGQIAVPSTLWSMPRLRHVQVHPRAAFALPMQDHELESSVALANMVTLSSPILSHKEEAEKLLRRLIQLKKLRCIIWAYWSRMFPAMVILDQLESLKIFYHDIIVFPRELSFPMNLKKLTLSNFRLPWKCSEAVRQLPQLEVLKLLSRAFEGQTWDMTAGGEFQNLMYLKLANLNLVNWNASGDHFPRLERLVLQSCKKLERVPSSFGEIPTLQMVEMHWCSQSATNSLDTIYEQQLELGNKEFKVLKNHPVVELN